ncbi:MAG: tRNA guanosine(34) transglycosylase Tgt, partial [Trueperaceae bacterium]
MSTSFGYRVLARDGAARRGRIATPHGPIETPAFVAVATQGAIKSVLPRAVRNAGSQVLFANTYHLYLRPGAEIVAAHGGLHRFMGWDGPILTDSGGFQVFSLGAGIEHGVGKVASIFPGEGVAPAGARGRSGLVQVDEEGVWFVSHVDGSRHRFTPERSIRTQRRLGADMVLAFDECTSPLHDQAYTAASAERTHRWAERSLRAFHDEAPVHPYRQALYGVVQGGAFEAERIASARTVGAMTVDGRGFDGMAIGGNLGDTRETMHRVLAWTTPYLPDDLPRHLLGIGDVPSLFEAAERGVDTFDCVAPTRNARNGGVLARFDDDGRPFPTFRRNLKNARYANDLRPIDRSCTCEACAGGFSRAYLRHLLKANEQVGQQLATVHNLRFMAAVMREIRTAIEIGRLQEAKEAWLGP